LKLFGGMQMETIKMQNQLLTKIESGATVTELQEYFKEILAIFISIGAGVI